MFNEIQNLFVSRGISALSGGEEIAPVYVRGARKFAVKVEVSVGSHGRPVTIELGQGCLCGEYRRSIARERCRRFEEGVRIAGWALGAVGRSWNRFKVDPSSVRDVHPSGGMMVLAFSDDIYLNYNLFTIIIKTFQMAQREKWTSLSWRALIFYTFRV